MRSVVQTPEFLTKLEELAGHYSPEERDNFLFAFDSSLARHPEKVGVKIVDGSPAIWMSATVRSYYMSPVHLFYTFNETHVYLLGITLASESSGYD